MGSECSSASKGRKGMVGIDTFRCVQGTRLSWAPCIFSFEFASVYKFSTMFTRMRKVYSFLVLEGCCTILAASSLFFHDRRIVAATLDCLVCCRYTYRRRYGSSDTRLFLIPLRRRSQRIGRLLWGAWRATWFMDRDFELNSGYSIGIR